MLAKYKTRKEKPHDSEDEVLLLISIDIRKITYV